MQKKTIFIFSTAYFPCIGGAEVAIKEITDKIPDYDFILFTAKIKRGLLSEEKIGNVLVYRLGFGFSFDKILLPVLAFIKFFQLTLSPILLWGIMASYGGIAVYFIKLFKPKIPFLLSLQEGDSETHLKYGKFGLIGFFGKRIIRKADYIQVISNYLKDFAVSRGARSPVAITPNGVDIKKIKSLVLRSIPVTENGQISNLKSIIQNLKLKHNIKNDEKIIITTSRLVYKNGIDVLIKAIAELKKINFEFHPTDGHSDGKKIKLLILGDGELKNELESLTLKLNLKNEVLFLGFVSQDEIYDYLAISDVFCRPSRSEGLGNSFLEAMAAGVPVIGTNVGGISDFLKDKETGLFSKVNDARDLAEKIKLLLEDSELRGKITENGKKLVEENYDWDNISKKMKEIFLKLEIRLI